MDRKRFLLALWASLNRRCSGLLLDYIFLCLIHSFIHFLYFPSLKTHSSSVRCDRWKTWIKLCIFTIRRRQMEERETKLFIFRRVWVAMAVSCSERIDIELRWKKISLKSFQVDASLSSHSHKNSVDSRYEFISKLEKRKWARKDRMLRWNCKFSIATISERKCQDQ